VLLLTKPGFKNNLPVPVILVPSHLKPSPVPINPRVPLKTSPFIDLTEYYYSERIKI